MAGSFANCVGFRHFHAEHAVPVSQRLVHVADSESHDRANDLAGRRRRCIRVAAASRRLSGVCRRRRCRRRRLDRFNEIAIRIAHDDGFRVADRRRRHDRRATFGDDWRVRFLRIRHDRVEVSDENFHHRRAGILNVGLLVHLPIEVAELRQLEVKRAAKIRHRVRKVAVGRVRQYAGTLRIKIAAPVRSLEHVPVERQRLLDVVHRMDGVHQTDNAGLVGWILVLLPLRERGRNEQHREYESFVRPHTRILPSLQLNCVTGNRGFPGRNKSRQPFYPPTL